MTCFVIRRETLLTLTHQMTLSFRTEHNFLDRADKVVLSNFFTCFAGCKNRTFVHERVELSTRKAWGTLRDYLKVNIRTKWLLA